jgi:hypothetical protein
VIVDHPLQPFLERRASEIDKQPNGLLGQTKVGLQLLHVRLAERIDALDFNQQSIVNYQIGSKCGAEKHSFEFDVDRSLPIDPISDLDELAG